MKILIVDDEKTFIEELADIIFEKYDSEIVSAVSSKEMNDKKIDLHSVDIAFIDIMLKDECGINLGSFIHQKKPEIKIVFISGYPEMVADVFLSVPAFGFIDKPIRKEKVFSYLDKAINDNEDKMVIFSSHGQDIYFNVNNIIYIESRKKEAIFHLVREETIIIGKLDDIEKIVGKQFVRCHKSYLVNMKYISCVQSMKFKLLNNEMINISRSFKESALRRYYRFKGGASL